MMKKIAIYSLSALLIVGLAAFQQPKKPKKSPKKAAKKEVAATPKVVLSDKTYDVKFDKTFHDFGKVNEGEQVETIYTLTNVGKEPVLIQSDQVECGCTTPTYSKEPIMPGKSTNIKVGFNTNGKLGTNNKKVTLTTNGGKHELTFKCEVAEKAKVDPIEPGNQMKIKTN
jgi:hypothetical protein